MTGYIIAQECVLNLIETDFQFHKTIINGCNNLLFISLFETLKSFLYVEIEQSQEDYKNLLKIPTEHELHVNALLTGDKTKAYTAYSSHIANIKNRLKNR